MLPPPALTVSIRIAGSAIGTPATDSAPSAMATPPLIRLASARVPPMSSVSSSPAPTAAPIQRAPTTPPAGPDNARLAARCVACSAPSVPPLEVMLRMAKRKEQRDRDRLRRERAHLGRHARHFGVGERLDRAARSHALPHSDHVRTGDEGWRVIAREIV